MSGFEVIDVFYHDECNGCGASKAILIKTGPDEFREIYHLEAHLPGESATPSFVVSLGRDKILGTLMASGRFDLLEDYYWFNREGPVRIDITPVWEAAKSTLPKDYGIFRVFDGRTTLPASTATVWTITAKDWGNCWGSEGAVIVKFRLERGRIIVTSKHWDRSMSVY
jgi:hypothetical protein